MLTLAFDTSAAHCAAALLSGDQILATTVEPMAKGQAERLMPLLEEILTGAGKTWADLDRIGVGIGPGNFTGIRIAVSAARGLALSLGIPAIGVSSTEALARSCATSKPVLALIDARGGQIYAQAFKPDGTATGGIAVGTFETLCAGFPADRVDVAGFRADEVAAAKGGSAIAVSWDMFAPTIARIAASLTPDGTRPAPLYMRPADAAPPRDPAPVIL